jgi:iron complex outermembrane receptor protein
MLRTEATLGETLANEAGVSSSFFGQGSSRPIIRGLAGDRVRMLEGGLGTGDASDVSVDHAVSTDPLQAERIEVLRGPSTLLYGSSAIGGAVNIIDERIPTTRASEPFSGTLDLRGGSVSNERVGSLSLNGGSEDWAWHANVMARDTDNYEIPGFARRGEEHHEGDDHEEEENPFGLLPNSDLESRGGRFGVTRFFGKSGFLGVAVSGFETEYGIPAGHAHEEEHQEHGDEQHGEEEGDENVRIDMDQQRVDLRGLINREFGIFRAVRVRVAANDYEHVELEGGERGTLFFNDYAEGRVELVQEERNGLTGTIGIQYADRDLESIGAESFIPPSQSERWALFAVEELERGDLTWQLGARFETQDSRATGQGSTSHDGLSGSLGLVYELTDTWSLAGSLSRSVKLPAPEELFANGPHLATLSFEIGDPQLTEEKGLGVDVSLRKTQGRVTGELTLFRQDFDDFVYQAFTGEEQDDLPVVVFRQANAEFLGAELTARVELIDLNGHHLHLRLVADTVEAELDAGGNLPRIPPASFGGGLHYHSERWNAMAEVRVIDDQTDVAVNETPTDGYTFVNASVGHRFIFGGRIVDLLLRGRNLTDEEGRVHTSFLKDQIVLPGRDVSLSARFWF